MRQLGPTWLVYPGATHTRFEHSLGVYGTTVRYLQSLLARESVRQSLDEVDVRTVLMAGLLHDVGHYPFAHSLEALHHKARDTPRHEDLAVKIIEGRAPGLERTPDTIASRLEREVGVEPGRVAALIAADKASLTPVDRLLRSIISSAIDADKMDYLWRDSVHLGVPYGRNYDRERLLNALTVDADGQALAVSSKGVVSAEIFLFCRYTMFSEVYWHHTVRSVSAMLEAAWADLVEREDPDPDDLTSRLLAVGDDQLLRTLAAESAPSTQSALLLSGVVADRREPYKRLVTWSRVYDEPDKRAAWERLYGLDLRRQQALVERIRERLSRLGRAIPKGGLILDVPPRDKDTLPDIAVHRERAGAGAGAYTRLAECSRIVAGIAADFIGVVKKIRLFVHPQVARELGSRQAEVEEALREVILGEPAAG